MFLFVAPEAPDGTKWYVATLLSSLTFELTPSFRFSQGAQCPRESLRPAYPITGFHDATSLQPPLGPIFDHESYNRAHDH